MKRVLIILHRNKRIKIKGTIIKMYAKPQLLFLFLNIYIVVAFWIFESEHSKNEDSKKHYGIFY